MVVKKEGAMRKQDEWWINIKVYGDDGLERIILKNTIVNIIQGRSRRKFKTSITGIISFGVPNFPFMVKIDRRGYKPFKNEYKYYELCNKSMTFLFAIVRDKVSGLDKLKNKKTIKKKSKKKWGVGNEIHNIN